MKILLFLLAFSVIKASNYPFFTEGELNKIAGLSGKIAKNRVLDYAKNIDAFKKLPKQKQLTRVNYYLNQLSHQTDIINTDKRDNWETPKEFLT